MISNLPQREEYLRKKRNRKILKLSFVIFLLLFIVGIISYTSYRPELRISKVELSGGTLVTTEAVQKESLEYLSGSYFWLFPKNNVFLYKKEMLTEYLKEKFKRIDTIKINRKDFQTISVNITERKPFAIWCRNKAVTTTNTDDVPLPTCYFMDQNSNIFAEAPNFSGDAYLKFYGKIEVDNPIGAFYISSTTEFTEIANFVKKVKQLGIEPQYIVAKENNEYSLVLSSGGEIFFDLKESLSQVGDNLEALLDSNIFNKSNLNNLPIEYIDLRYGNKLFYKLRE